jgi:hypothetical protein
MLSLQTLNNIEALLMSRSHPMWGEFMPLAQTIGEVQAAKAALMQGRARPAQEPPASSVNVTTVGQTGGVTAATVPPGLNEVVNKTPGIGDVE